MILAFKVFGCFLLFSMVFHGSPDNQVAKIVLVFMVIGRFFAIFNSPDNQVIMIILVFMVLGWFLLFSMVFHGPPDNQVIKIVWFSWFLVGCCWFLVKTNFPCSRIWLVFHSPLDNQTTGYFWFHILLLGESSFETGRMAGKP